MRKSSYPISYTIDVARRSVTSTTKLGTGTTTDGDANGNVSRASIKIDANGLEMLTYNNLMVGGFARTGKLTLSSDWTKGVSESSTFQNGRFLKAETIAISCTVQDIQE